MLEVDIELRRGDFLLAAAFTSQADGVTALYGRSGSGKTSLVGALAGLLRPQRGRIRLDGRTLFDSALRTNLPPERRRLGYVFQEGRLFPHLSVAANLAYGLKRVPPAERFLAFDAVVDLLALSGLLQRRPATLSGGEKQRVALGRALLAQPRLLLLDEPLASLDQAMKDEVLPFLERLRDDLKLPMIYVSHQMGEVVRLADRLVLLDQGRVAAAGSVGELLGRLDLRHLTGQQEAGALLTARLVELDVRYGLARLELGGASLWIPAPEARLGSALRLRVQARDVAIALQPPQGLSVQNVVPATLAEIRAEAPYVDLSLVVAGQRLSARITGRAADQLGLQVGQPVYALLKAIAVERQSLARRPRGAS
ncbi:MAG TPA: molybdenum ABC transporter ATP-binding protein [Kiloniellales bacterium]|nr:molybdenum ABC transporter ATP-binding protein [Kiloniellales bacterium]